MADFVQELVQCDRYEALNLIKGILFIYSSLFSQTYEDTLNELK